ncbi:hypothetical protein AB1Y20_015073 [Prymnesium parvum]|uniref:Uncharacterized protein n=1 Tax=Prymnesium parvum TaxID=97485 RepID=A0AB34K1H1_PRYPA
MNGSCNPTANHPAPARNLSWPMLLEAKLRHALPGCRVQVTVRAYGGWTSETAAYHLHRLLNQQVTGQLSVNTVLLDNSVNDMVLSAGKGRQSFQRTQYLLAAIESMVRRLARSAIPVMLIDTLDRPSCTSMPTSLYERISRHWRVTHAVKLLTLQGTAADDIPDRVRTPRWRCWSLTHSRRFALVEST